MAGPPCQPFSILNEKRRSDGYDPFGADPLSRPVVECCRHIRDRKPKTFVLEQVSCHIQGLRLGVVVVVVVVVVVEEVVEEEVVVVVVVVAVVVVVTSETLTVGLGLTDKQTWFHVLFVGHALSYLV